MIGPDYFANDWHGWLTNRCGHIVLGIGVSVVMIWAWWWSPMVATDVNGAKIAISGTYFM